MTCSDPYTTKLSEFTLNKLFQLPFVASNQSVEFARQAFCLVRFAHSFGLSPESTRCRPAERTCRPCTVDLFTSCLHVVLEVSVQSCSMMRRLFLYDLGNTCLGKLTHKQPTSNPLDCGKELGRERNWQQTTQILLVIYIYMACVEQGDLTSLACPLPAHRAKCSNQSAVPQPSLELSRST